MPRPPTCAPFSTSQTPVRARRARQFQCLHRPLHTTTSVPPARSFSTTSARPVVPQQGTPRWMYTPPHMTAPVSLKKNSPDNVWRVNESQARLDDFYARLLGEGGPALLTDEVKWLAVTHKSFDQGRRGYNDRLAFLGKRIMNLQISLALLNRVEGAVVVEPDKYDREPFSDPSVDLLPRLSEESRRDMTSSIRLATFAENMGMLNVLRWKPRKASDVIASGSEQTMSQAIYAIVGALALQQGGEIAVRTVRERILPNIGFK